MLGPGSLGVPPCALLEKHFLSHPRLVFRMCWSVLLASRAFTSLVVYSLKWEVLGWGPERQDKEDSGKATTKGCTQHIIGTFTHSGPKEDNFMVVAEEGKAPCGTWDFRVL